MTIDIESIIQAAKAGGEVLRKYFGQSLETTQKTIASDFQTKADTESEAAILPIIQAAFPTATIFSEEAGWIKRDPRLTFYIDPLDGTNNFVLGIPNFCVSIGLFDGDEIIAGVIYHPILDLVYSAEKGKGAFLDGVRLQVNKIADMTKASVCNDQGYGAVSDDTAITKALYALDAKRVVMNWSGALDFCLLASGRVEGMVQNGLQIHDFAAGKLIAREASAKITDFAGQPEQDTNRFFLVSNGTAIHERLVEVMKSEESPGASLRH